MTRRRTRPTGTVLAVLAAVGLAACTPAQAVDEQRTVVVTTPVLADLVAHVAGDRAAVVPLVPPGTDGSLHEPSLRDARMVAGAVAAFSNDPSQDAPTVLRLVEGNLPEGAPHARLATSAAARGAAVLSRVEDRALDAVWLGLSVTGTADALGVDRSARVRLTATDAEGPGAMAAYLTDTFGGAQVYASAADGVVGEHSVLLRSDAHTHMSWAFTDPGVYRLTLRADLVPEGGPAVPLGSTTLTFAVGVDPLTHAGPGVQAVLDAGHADLTVDLDELVEDPAGGAGGAVLRLAADAAGDHDHAGQGHAHGHHRVLRPETTVVSVPPSSLLPLPAGAQAALGERVRPGDPVYQLPQAVLGRHLHGQIDPYLWLDVRNAQVYVEVVRDTLEDADPAGAQEYRRNAAAYLDRLEALDEEVAATVSGLPGFSRYLVTTYDSVAYLASAYGLRVVGSLAPDRGSDPGLRQRRQLTRTVATMELPAVFLEVGVDPRTSVLRELAADAGVEVCPIYVDTLDDAAPDYVSMMRANAASLHRCLSPDEENL